MLGLPHRDLDEIAGAIADGLPIDWPADPADVDGYESRVLNNLKIVAQIAALHASPSFLSSMTSGSLGTIDERRAATLLQPGSMWGHLKILERVGQGRFGVVYRAFDATLDREVALKILRAREASSDFEIAHEGRMMARIHHPNVVTVFGAQVIGSEVGIWMQFVGGRSLEAELQQKGPFSTAEIVRVGIQLCDALAAVHSVGLVHRDVKAANVMRGPNNEIVLGDFGTGRLIDDARSGMAGTPLYLAPEAFDGAPANPQSDIYSLGVLLFHVATGKYPVNGRSLQDLGEAHRSGKRIALEALRPDLPDDLVATIDRALATDTASRWKTAGALLIALDAARASGQAAVPQAASKPVATSRSTAVFFVAAAAATVMLVGSVAKVPQAGSSEVSIETSPFADVSTSSARARRSYETAVSLMVGPPPWPRGEIERLLRSATEIDPKFAMARAVLADSLFDTSSYTGEFLEEGRIAASHAVALPEVERTFIEASLHVSEARATLDNGAWRRHLTQVALQLEQVLQLRPRHRLARERLYDAYTELQDQAGVLRVFLLAAQQSPKSIIDQNWPAIQYARAGDLDNAEIFRARSMALVSAQSDNEYAFHVTWSALLPAQRSWLANRPDDALRSLRQVMETPPAGSERTNTLRRQLSGMALGLGRLADAAQIAREAADSIDADSNPDPFEAQDLALAVKCYRGDRVGTAQLLREHFSTPSSARRALWLPIPEDLMEHQLQLVAASNAGSTIYDFDREFARARIALADGRVDEAIAGLTTVSLRRPEHGISRLMRISTFIADAWIRKGRIEPAIAALEESTRERAATTFGASSSALWMQTRARLAGLYRSAGRISEAERIEQHLRQLLAVADDDFPLRVQLMRARF